MATVEQAGISETAPKPRWFKGLLDRLALYDYWDGGLLIWPSIGSIYTPEEMAELTDEFGPAIKPLLNNAYFETGEKYTLDDINRMPSTSEN